MPPMELSKLYIVFLTSSNVVELWQHIVNRYPCIDALLFAGDHLNMTVCQLEWEETREIRTKIQKESILLAEIADYIVTTVYTSSYFSAALQLYQYRCPRDSSNFIVHTVKWCAHSTCGYNNKKVKTLHDLHTMLLHHQSTSSKWEYAKYEWKKHWYTFSIKR